MTELSDLGRRGCECIGCLRLFWGVEAYDLHRIGEGKARRCATEAELSKHLERDDLGVWFNATGRRRLAYNRGKAAGTEKTGEVVG